MSISEITEQARRVLDVPVTSCPDDDLIAEIEECETAMRVLLATQLRLVTEAEQRGIRHRPRTEPTEAWLQQGTTTPHPSSATTPETTIVPSPDVAS
jgi:hypothetical protein